MPAGHLDLPGGALLTSTDRPGRLIAGHPGAVEWLLRRMLFGIARLGTGLGRRNGPARLVLVLLVLVLLVHGVLIAGQDGQPRSESHVNDGPVELAMVEPVEPMPP